MVLWSTRQSHLLYIIWMKVKPLRTFYFLTQAATLLRILIFTFNPSKLLFSLEDKQIW